VKHCTILCRCCCRHFEKLKSLRNGMISLLRVQCSLTTILHNAVKFAAAKVDLINSFFCETDGDPVFWEEIRCANSEGAATRFLEAYTEGNAMMLLHRQMMGADGQFQSAKLSTGSAMLNCQGCYPEQKFWSQVLLSNVVFSRVRASPCT